MGFPQTYPHAVVFGPITHGGIGSINLRIEQGIIIINKIMETMRTPGYGHDVLQIFLQTFHHASGLSQPLLEYLDQRATNLEVHYYVYYRKFLTENKIQMEFTCVNCHKLEQENYLFLMDEACAKTKEELSDPTIRTINYCRNYLKVKFFQTLTQQTDITFSPWYYKDNEHSLIMHPN